MVDKTKNGEVIDYGRVLKNSYRSEEAALAVVNVGSLVPDSYDAIQKINVSATVEQFVYKSGGLAGNTIAVLTITYTDASKEDIESVVRS